MVKTLPSNAGRKGLIPSQGTKVQELRSHMPQGVAKKMTKNKQVNKEVQIG